MLNERLECDKYKEYNIAYGEKTLGDSELKYALGLIARDYWYNNKNSDLGKKIKETVEELSTYFDKLSRNKELQRKLSKNFLEQETPGNATFWSIIADGITKGEITNTMEALKKEGYELTESNDSILDKIIAYVYDTITNYQKDWHPPGSNQESILTLKSLNRFNSITLTICICQIILYYKCYKKYANKENELIFVQEVFSKWCKIFPKMERLFIKDEVTREEIPKTTLAAKDFINDILNECGISKINRNNYLLLKVEIEKLEENAKEHWNENRANKFREKDIQVIKEGKEGKGNSAIKGIAELLTN